MRTKACYRPDLFASYNLTSLELVEAALDNLSGALNEGNILRVLEDIMREETANILVLVLSNLPREFSEVIIRTCPTTAAAYTGSFHDRLIQFLSTTLLFLFYADRTITRTFSVYHHKVQNACTILKAFQGYILHSAIPDSPEKEGEDLPFVRKGKVSQKKLKQGKKPASAMPSVDVKCYDALGIAPPSYPSHVEGVVDDTLDVLTEILSSYFQYLTAPGATAFLKEQCVVAHDQPSEQTPVEQYDERKETIGMSEVVPSANPMVRPMKSALHFDSPEGFGAWMIIISKNAHDTLRSTHRKDLSTFDIIVRKIKDLSSGHFSDDNQKRLSGAVASDVAVYEAKMTRDLRLVYQIDLIPSDDEREQQAVKIFGIYTHAQMDHRLWASISSQLRKRGQLYRERCAVRKRSEHADKDMFVPETFPPLPEVSAAEVENLPDLLPNDTARVHSRLVVEKFVTFSQPFLNSIMADLDVTLPHLVSSQEKKIIENPTSCYVIGRSGTGKTTTMLFKMLLVERTYHLMGDNVSRPRQVFVTKSRMLARKVQEYFNRLASSLTRASQTLSELQKINSVHEDRDPDANATLVDEDDENEWRTDLPQKFSELEDKHFPLFITYDGLCDLIEGDFVAAKGSTKSRAPRKGPLINFEIFEASYWAHFSETVRKGLDPALVYSEIIGVIKGSEEALTQEKRFLSKEVYEDLSRRQHSTLTGRTADVYRLFQAYVQRKKAAGEHDVADRTHAVLKFFQEQGVPGMTIDHLYIDEVQDNLLIDTMVLRALCSNSHGLFWAGDTAQTISVGSSFRFDGLKAFQFRLETQHQKKNGSYVRVEDPELFQLAINYRSHAGIVDCAHSVIDLITMFWSDSIDRLSPEVGIVDGFKPAFFSNEDRHQLESFIFGAVGSHIEFGAQQCILVRNEAAKERLLKQVGEVGLVLTIYESKGLEFNDVLLYDFFCDSVVGASAWRVVLNAIEDWTNVGPKIPAPTFDRIKHASVCTELKSLYVAITRARENIWIADGSETGKWMRMFWTSRDLVNNYAPGNDAPQLATSSTPEEWAAQGRELFDQRKFGPAKHCYMRALQPKLAAIAGAYYARQKARAVPTVKAKLPERQRAFREAGDAFLSCANDATKEKTRLTYLGNSALCYEDAGDRERAAEVHRMAKNFDRSGELYRDLKKFDEAVDVVDEARNSMRPETVDSIFKRARLAYFDARDIKKGSRLFDSTDEVLEYLEDRGFDMARADLLESLGETVAAAELHYLEGRRETAISLFLKNRDDKDGLHRGVECIIEGLWQCCSFGVPPNRVRGDREARTLLAFLPRVDASVLSPEDTTQLETFRAISTNNLGILFTIGVEYAGAGKAAPALLCLDHVFSWPLKLDKYPLQEVITSLTNFNRYITLFSRVAFQIDPTQDPSIGRLFGFSRVAENTIPIPATAYFLHQYLSKETKSLNSTDFKLTLGEFRFHFQRALSSRLRLFADAANESCLRCKAFSPCLPFVASGSCPRIECPEDHILAKDIAATFYNQRVRIHLLQILIVQSLRDNSNEEGNRGSPKYIIKRFYNALYPPHSALGTIANLDLSAMPEAGRAINLLRYWVQSLAYTQSFHPHTTFLTDTLQISSLALAFDRDRATASGYLYLAPYWRTEQIPPRYKQQEHFLVGYLLASVRGRALGEGALALHHCLQRRLPINVAVLCNYIEFLCSSFVLRSRAKMSSGFHNVTLPKSWLIKYFAWDAPHFSPTMQTNSYLALLDCMVPLLEHLYAGGDAAGYLLYGTRATIATLPPSMRNVFIARILQAVSLLGYNSSNSLPQENVRKIVASLKKPGRVIPLLYREYVEASQTWEGLARVVRRSLEKSSADEMIHLQNRGRIKHTQYSLRGVRRVIFVKEEDILPLLRNELVDIVQEPSPHPQSNEAGDPATQPAEGDVLPEEEEGLEEETVMEMDASTQAEEAVGEGEEQVVQRPPPTPEEHEAASFIQRTYLRALSRRKGVSKTGTAGTLAQVYIACLAIADSISDRSYRLMLLGPLVHLLVCLDFAKMDALAFKKRTKGQLKNSVSEEMERLDDLLTQTTRANKAMVEAHKALQPTSALHKSCDKAELIKWVRKANDVLLTLPFKESIDFSEDRALGERGILTIPAPPKRKPKPSLVLDDGDFNCYI